MPVEFRKYEGDGKDLEDVHKKSWAATYEGKQWIFDWDKNYFQWRLLDARIHDPELLVCAYEGTNLLGYMLGKNSLFAANGQVYNGSLTSFLSVDPAIRVRGLGARLVQKQRQIHQERNLDFSMGLSTDYPNAMPKKFWDGVKRRYPEELDFLTSCQFWCAVIDSQNVSRAGVSIFERTAPYLSKLIPSVPSISGKNELRTYRAEDLDACLKLANEPIENVALQMKWTLDSLSAQIDHPYVETLVIEKDGAVEGFVSGHIIDMIKKDRMTVGMIELCKFSKRLKNGRPLYEGMKRRMTERGVDIVQMMTTGQVEGSTLMTAGFLPANPEMRVLMLLKNADIKLSEGESLDGVFI